MFTTSSRTIVRSLASAALIAGLIAGCGDPDNNTTSNNTTANNTNANNTSNNTTANNTSNNTTANNTSNNTAGESHDTGKRCDIDDDCQGDIAVCFTEFFGERPVCTQECGAALPCPGDMECIGGLTDYNGISLGPRCVRPCETDADCEAFGSECDTDDTSGQGPYCF